MQISKFLRKGENGRMTFWCQGCEDTHTIIVEGSHAWGYNGNPDSPTFSPSIAYNGMKIIRDPITGQWTGEWVRDENGEGVKQFCHSFIREGMIEFLPDSKHALAGQTVPLAELPQWMRDPQNDPT